MTNNNFFAVAITRTCGSGGTYIAKQLAQDLNINVYDRKLLALASDDSGISETLFAAADENTKKTLLYKVSRKIYNGGFIPSESGNLVSDQNLFNYQAKVLKKLLDYESYICLGRAADFVLKDQPNVLKVYIDAPYEARITREMNRQGISYEQAVSYVNKYDKYRESYYTYHTGKKWQDLSNYDLCLNSACIGLDTCVAVIKTIINLKYCNK